MLDLCLAPPATRDVWLSVRHPCTREASFDEINQCLEGDMFSHAVHLHFSARDSPINTLRAHRGFGVFLPVEHPQAILAYASNPLMGQSQINDQKYIVFINTFAKNG